MPESLQVSNGEKGAGFETPKRFSVFVAYNGIEKSFTIVEEEAVHALLSQAVKEFNVNNQPHVLSLFNNAGVELPDAAKLGELGVRPGDHLLLRPSAVKGG
jgi:hypothetical protein